jgi:hypothetical protein
MMPTGVNATLPFALLGPVSSGTPNGGGPLINGLLLLVGSWMIVNVWRGYLRRESDLHVTKAGLVEITAIAVVLIASSIWGFAH